MKKKELISDIVIFGLVATVFSAILGFVVGMAVAFWKSIMFFQRPENIHFTEYNTPVQISDGFLIQGVQDPLTLIAILIPWMVLIGLIFAFYRSGTYKDY